MKPIIDMTGAEWKAYRAQLSIDAQDIKIPSDVNPSIAMVILSKIDTIYSNLRLQFSDLDSSKERIDMMVRELERVGLTGKNEDERKRNAVMEVRKSLTENGLTLYDMQRESTERFLFIKGVLDVLINKQNRLITINGLLKLDKDLMVSSESYSSMNRPS